MVAGRPNSTWRGGDGRGIRVVVADRKTVVLITIMLLPKWSAFPRGRQPARAGGVDAENGNPPRALERVGWHAGGRRRAGRIG